MKKTVAIILLLIIAVSIQTFTMAPNAAGQNENVKILNYSYYIDMLDNIVIVGEVQNTGPNVVDYVLISGTITGSDGSQSQSGNRAWATNLLSKQKAPFYIEFLPPNGGTWYGIDITDIALNVYQAPTTAQYQYPDITIINHQAAPTATGEYWVKGQLKNIGAQTTTGISVFATFYNSEGTPVATGYTDPVATLAAGSTTDFKVAAFDLNQTIVPADKKIVSYSLLVQLKSPMLSGTAPVSTPSATSPSNNQPNADADQTILYAAVVAVAIIAVVTTLVLLRRRKLKQTARSKLMKPVNPSKKAKRNKK